MFSISQTVIRLHSEGLQPNDPAEAPVNARATNLPGYDSTILENLHVLLVGAGGLGGEIGHGLVKNGVGHLYICDHDTVELSNLNRQFFYEKDLYKNKAIQLSHNLLNEVVQKINLIGLAMNAQTAIKTNRVGEIDAVICAVDNDETRVLISRWALTKNVPVIFTAVNATADYGYVFIQTSLPNAPCFGCLFPDAVENDTTEPCAVGASIDILKSVSGPVLYGLGSLFLKNRVRKWVYKEIFLSGEGQDGNREIMKRSNCPICGKS